MSLRSFAKITLALFTVAVLGACTQESKVKSAVETYAMDDINKEFDKAFGAKESKIMSELKTAFVKKLRIEVTDIKIEGETATGKANVTMYNKEFGGLAFLVALNAPEHDKKGRNVASILDEVRKEKPEVPNMENFPTETHTRNFKAEKKDGKWVVSSLKEEKEKSKR